MLELEPAKPNRHRSAATAQRAAALYEVTIHDRILRGTPRDFASPARRIYEASIPPGLWLATTESVSVTVHGAIETMFFFSDAEAFETWRSRTFGPQLTLVAGGLPGQSEE